MATTQGKCINCKRGYRFKNELLKNAYCPRCGEKLRQTSIQLKWNWYDVIVLNSFNRNTNEQKNQFYQKEVI